MPLSLSRARDWARSRPTAADGLLAVALAAAAVALTLVTPHRGDASMPVAVVLDAVACLALAARRAYPVLVTLVVVGAAAWGTVEGVLVTTTVAAVLVAVYSAGAHRPLAGGVLSPVAAMLAVPVSNAVSRVGMTAVGDVASMLFIAATWWIGRGLRLRRAYTAELEARARGLERARDVYARAALAEERSRIARELHDVVAHHVSVMTVQAAAARRILDRSPDDAREALAAVESTGRAALAEMRRLVGVLRTEGRAGDREETRRTPQPGIADIGVLLGQLRETGLDVELLVEGRQRAMPAGVDLSAYRVVQESLTNTLKHAGSGARARVTITYSERRVEIEVADDGRGRAAAFVRRPDLPGHGLVGMRERVAMYGGSLRAGPRAGGGYQVSACFPLDAGTLRHDAPLTEAVPDGRSAP